MAAFSQDAEWEDEPSEAFAAAFEALESIEAELQCPVCLDTLADFSAKHAEDLCFWAGGPGPHPKADRVSTVRLLLEAKVDPNAESQIKTDKVTLSVSEQGTPVISLSGAVSSNLQLPLSRSDPVVPRRRRMQRRILTPPVLPQGVRRRR